MHHGRGVACFTRYAVDKVCLRSCVRNACGHQRQMQIWKHSSRPMPNCRLDASESLPKSAVSSAKFLPRRDINFMRTKIKNTTNDPRPQETFKLVLPSRRRWHSCQSIGLLAVPDFMFEPDLPAMTESPNNKRFGKKSTQRKHAIHLHAFQDVHASSRQLLMQTPIRLSYFRMPVWRTTFGKTVEKSNSFRSTAWLSCKACLSMVWLATTTLKVVVEEFAHRPCHQ